MKPSFEAVRAPGEQSFLVRKFEEKSFSAPYHFHPEYELTLILRGGGSRYVGAQINDFASGDLVLLGANLPHCWKTAPSSAGLSSSVVIQFKQDFLGPHFLLKPEMRPIFQLLARSSHGLQFTGDTRNLQKKILKLLRGRDPLRRVLDFLDLLYELAGTKRFVALSKQNLYAELSGSSQQRVHAVMEYIVEHFQTSISLEAAAEAAHLTPPAFCKYFKKTTRKTFMEAVTDYRLDFALKELAGTDKPVAQIGFDSGFNDISNFHKTFKQKLKTSPLNYRKKFTDQDNPINKKKRR